MPPPSMIRALTVNDTARLRDLNEEAFGPGRFARTAYRIRENAETDARLNLGIWDGSAMIGAVQFTPVAVGGIPGGLLLGPLVIAESHKNQGFGLMLMMDGLERASTAGYRYVILVGDLPYYARAGFLRIPVGQITLPGPVDLGRLLYVDLVIGAFAGACGAVRSVSV